MADNLTSVELKKNISDILKGGDLATLTSKKVRQILESKYGVSLKHRKKEIDNIVMALVDEESDNDETTSEQPKTSSGTDGSPSKKQKVSSKSERVSVIVPSNKNKQSSDSENESADDDEIDSEDEKPKREKKTNKRKAAASKEKTKSSKQKTTGDQPKRKSGFSMPMALSPELAAFLGEPQMARSEVVKRMWAIIKERDLLDPSNRRYTLCDEELEKIIGQRRFLTFSMMKYLKKHVKDPSLMTQ